MNVPKATYEIIYNGTNITGSIKEFVKSFSYTDKSKGEADELEIVVEDSARLWQNDWYPTKGDKVSAKIFYLGNTLNCGTFTVDEISGSGSTDGDTVSIKALAAGINKKIRTKNSFAHEKKTLREIVNTIAAKHGFTVQGTIDNIRIDRETQNRETDLGFLQRISDELGYTFSIRDNALIFTNVFEIEKKADALTIYRDEITSYEITDKTSKSYKAVKISYHNPRQKKVIKHEQTESEESYKGAKDDVLEIRCRVENKQQAEIKSKVALYKANSLQQEGSLEMPGNILILAGNNCTIEGLGMFSGKYYIQNSTHTVDPDGGYTTNPEIKRIGLVTKAKQKNTSKKTSTAQTWGTPND